MLVYKLQLPICTHYSSTTKLSNTIAILPIYYYYFSSTYSNCVRYNIHTLYK